MPKTPPVNFPPPGTVLLFPWGEGQLGACRVFRIEIPGHCKTLHALVGQAEWTGTAPPPLDHPALRALHQSFYHGLGHRPNLFWVDDPPPESFVVHGHIPLSPEEQEISSWTWASWLNFPHGTLVRWRWEHEREAVLAEQAAEAARQEEMRTAEAARRAAILANTTLPSILARPSLFPQWHDALPAKTIALLEAPIREFLKEIIDLPKPKRTDISRHLRLCVKALNQIDNDHDHPLCTIEREDIIDLFDEILTVAKQPGLLDKVDQWRDW